MKQSRSTEKRGKAVILLTGVTGFVGNAVLQRLVAEDTFGRVAVALRRSGAHWPERVLPYVIGDQTPSTDWTAALQGVSSVIHCAARVHVMTDAATDPLEEFRRVNVHGTLNLARQASVAGVRRFVFISSIKVNGESTQTGFPFKADDAPAPEDAYGISKFEAENGLRELAVQSGMEVVIIRPPLVYGAGVKANFATMMRWLRRGVPMPFGAIQNARSLVALGNLVDLIVTCVRHPAAANQIFLVSDGEDLSTTQLLRRVALAMNTTAWLLPVPSSVLKLATAALGKPDVARRLFASLQVDIEKTRHVLSWSPPLSLDQGLKQATEG